MTALKRNTDFDDFLASDVETEAEAEPSTSSTPPRPLLNQRIVGGSRLIRTGMGDDTCLADIPWAIQQHGATVDEIHAALTEQIALRNPPPEVSGATLFIPDENPPDFGSHHETPASGASPSEGIKEKIDAALDAYAVLCGAKAIKDVHPGTTENYHAARSSLDKAIAEVEDENARLRRANEHLREVKAELEARLSQAETDSRLLREVVERIDGIIQLSTNLSYGSVNSMRLMWPALFHAIDDLRAASASLSNTGDSEKTAGDTK